MKFSVNWLREFVELPATTAELSDLLTLAGVEIEGAEERGANFANVIVAQITESKQHPNADRLSVCQVDDGSGSPRQIVCGAKNYKVGDKVPLALPGAVLPGDLKIKASKLRGVESQGMLCSAKELRLSDESAGLLVLDSNAKIGTPIGEIFAADTILDVEVTPNRGDLLSHFGLAREIAALTRKTVSLPKISRQPSRKISESVRISAPRECPFYSARQIENVKVGPSPAWLRARLESVGLRSINNIVDIANFVMLEIGQPLHAFDLEKVHGGINVRLAAKDEKFLALDGKNYSLGENDLVIADDKRAVAIGGVMGGEDSGVTNATTDILLESAYFLPATVRRTARALNLPSDASYRFERGVDPEMTLTASQRATDLIREIAGGKAREEIAIAGDIPASPKNIALRYERVDTLLGISIPQEKVNGILIGFGLTSESKDESSTTWEIPSFRRDLQREVDLIEEIVRAWGVEKIAGSDRSRFTAMSEADLRSDFEMEIREQLVARGIFEARTSALIPRGASANAFELKNPLSEDHVALRPSLLPGLLSVLSRNVRAGTPSIRLFELGQIFRPANGAETTNLALLFSGATASASDWRAPTKRHLDFFDLKGALESLIPQPLSFRRAHQDRFALAAEILVGEKCLGIIGQLSASEAGESAPIFAAEIELDSLRELHRHADKFRELEKFPAVTRDIALIAPEILSHEEILRAIKAADEPLLERVELFDLFSGKGAESLGEGRKSLAYSLTYRDKNRTLTNEEVSGVHAKIRQRLTDKAGVELRE